MTPQRVTVSVRDVVTCAVAADPADTGETDETSFTVTASCAAFPVVAGRFNLEWADGDASAVAYTLVVIVTPPVLVTHLTGLVVAGEYTGDNVIETTTGANPALDCTTGVTDTASAVVLTVFRP
jgi:hypothetical protein